MNLEISIARTLSRHSKKHVDAYIRKLFVSVSQITHFKEKLDLHLRWHIYVASWDIFHEHYLVSKQQPLKHEIHPLAIGEANGCKLTPPTIPKITAVQPKKAPTHTERPYNTLTLIESRTDSISCKAQSNIWQVAHSIRKADWPWRLIDGKHTKFCSYRFCWTPLPTSKNKSYPNFFIIDSSVSCL